MTARVGDEFALGGGGEQLFGGLLARLPIGPAGPGKDGENDENGEKDERVALQGN